MQQHQNYTREITADQEEALSKIISRIPSGSVVLDVGCGTGMLGKYLGQHKQCVVDGLDIDPEAVALAKSKYRRTAVVNLERDCLTDIFKAETYDCIVMADVIEHLVHPEQLFQDVKQLLKPNGLLLFSIPNITHISAGLELVLGNFGYRGNGLLDSTHVRFYSKQGFIDTLHDHGIYPFDVGSVFKSLDETEFTTYQYFPKHWVQDVVNSREDALTYQWIISAKLFRPKVINYFADSKNLDSAQYLMLGSRLYWTPNSDEVFSETHSIAGKVLAEAGNQATIFFEFTQQNCQYPLAALRVDPVCDNTAFIFFEAFLTSPAKQVIWFTKKLEQHQLHNAHILPTIVEGTYTVFCENNDPQWNIRLSEETLKAIVPGTVLSLKISINSQFLIKAAASVIETLNSSLSDKQVREEVLRVKHETLLTEETTRHAQRNGQQAAQINILENSVAQKEQFINQLSVRMNELSNQNAADLSHIVLLQKHATLLEQKARNSDKKMVDLISSSSWKITKPLRVVRRFLSSSLTTYFRAVIENFSSYVWRKLPISHMKKSLIKYHLFSRFNKVFSSTRAYRAWNSEPNIRSPIVKNYNFNEESFVANEKEFVPLLDAPALESKSVLLICFYLPQFHAIEENNLWWGEGFTEWTNVRPAKPQFQGHYQPHIPGELGYYDLSDGSVQQRQVELAQIYGVGGFCFYFYWFGGKRLLETPVESYLTNKGLTLPFCLCWANENWSRRWDGLDQNVLIAQQHSPEDDLNFISYVSKYLSDERYIKIGGMPLLIVYRPSLLPSPRKTAQRWRSWCKANGIGDIYIAYTQSFESVDPAEYGFDAAIEFPPNNSAPPLITDTVKPIHSSFNTTVYDWDALAKRSENYKSSPYKLFRSVCPSWDNTPRRKNNSTVFLNSSPAKYQRWLENAINHTIKTVPSSSDRLVFINAWNEWAEGAHLEPDARYGYAWLQASRDALAKVTPALPLLLVTHDCHPHGAQFLTLEIGRQLLRNGFTLTILALDDGKLYDEFARLGNTVILSKLSKLEIASFFANLRDSGYRDSITSTVLCGTVLPLLKAQGFRVLSLIHELPGVIREMKQESNATIIANLADKLVFPAPLVSYGFNTIAPIEDSKIIIRPQGLLRVNPYKHRNNEARLALCMRYQLPKTTRFVVAIGYLDRRKGADLFANIAELVISNTEDLIFIWVGHSEPKMQKIVQAQIDNSGIGHRFILAGYDAAPFIYYAAASVFALTSREDPFPNVVLESVSVGVPVVAFSGTTGAADFIVEHGGRLAHFEDAVDFAKQITDLLELALDPTTCEAPKLSLQHYVIDLLHHLNATVRISVVLPNYNYGHLIERRLESIRLQSYPIYELIILDDNSTDDSVNRIKAYCEKYALSYDLHINPVNSGSVFRQWEKGAKLASGDIIWLAEADDTCEFNFLATLASSFDKTNTVIAYSQSKQIDELGNVLAPNYLAYTSDISDQWTQSNQSEGILEISNSLCIKNTIPNVSGALIRKSALLQAFDTIGERLFEFKVAGDWLIYLHLLAQGDSYFCSKSLNSHCRHQRSITSATDLHRHLAEVMAVQKEAGQLVKLPESSITNARAYIAHLCNHFGLTNTQALE